MPLSKALINENFEHAMDLMDQALSAEKGIRVTKSSASEATQFRILLNTVRREHRNMLGGQSPFDCLIFSLDGDAVLMKKAHKFFTHDVEEL